MSRLGTVVLLSLVLLAGAGSSLREPAFEKLQPELFGPGATFTNAFADVDGDGDLDLFVGFNGEPNRLYQNTRGTFAEVALTAGIADARPTRAAAWGDFDGDGDPDLLVGFTPGRGSVLRLYRNAFGRFEEVSATSGIARDSGAVRQLAWIDHDADGDLDLFVAFRDRPNLLLRNDAGQFTDVAPALGVADARRSVGAVWFDMDGDGDLDLYVANMDGDRNGLFRNDRGIFTDVAESAGVAWGGRTPNDATNGTVRPCVADVDGDGRLDLFAANYGKNGLFLNRGRGRFEDVSAAWGIGTDARFDACAFADFDHDGRVDLYVNGTVTGGVSHRDYLYRNTGAAFVEVTPTNIGALEADHGVQWADVDGDGAVDLALTGVAATGLHGVWRNLLPPADAARSLAVRVLDADGRATRAGAEVRIYAAGTRTLLGTRLVDTGSGYASQNDAPVHFGFAAFGRVDVEVTWPAAGSRVQVLRRNVEPSAYRGRVLEVRVSR